MAVLNKKTLTCRKYKRTTSHRKLRDAVNNSEKSQQLHDQGSGRLSRTQLFPATYAGTGGNECPSAPNPSAHVPGRLYDVVLPGHSTLKWLTGRVRSKGTSRCTRQRELGGRSTLCMECANQAIFLPSAEMIFSRTKCVYPIPR